MGYRLIVDNERPIWTTKSYCYFSHHCTILQPNTKNGTISKIEQQYLIY